MTRAPWSVAERHAILGSDQMMLSFTPDRIDRFDGRVGFDPVSCFPLYSSSSNIRLCACHSSCCIAETYFSSTTFTGNVLECSAVLCRRVVYAKCQASRHAILCRIHSTGVDSQRHTCRSQKWTTLALSSSEPRTAICQTAFSHRQMAAIKRIPGGRSGKSPSRVETGHVAANASR